ncbi:MAG: ABC transporter permease, partial [Mucinivorans sp.]
MNIALRYLLSRKSHSIVNLIALVSVLSIAVPVVAMVVVLSLHNGLKQSIEELYSKFDPELRVQPLNGRFFEEDSAMVSAIYDLEEVYAVSTTISDNVMVLSETAQSMATLTGVDSLYGQVVPLEQSLTQGPYSFYKDSLPQAIVGQGLAYKLQLSGSLSSPLELYALNSKAIQSLFHTTSYRRGELWTGALYALDEKTDSRYLFCSKAFAQELLGVKGRISTIDISLIDIASLPEAQHKIEQIVGPRFTVLSQQQQRSTVFRAVNQEKWVIFAMLFMVGVIAALSLVGSVVMLITEKREQNLTLINMGAREGMVRRIFAHLGWYITLTGVVVGLILGLLICWVQATWGVVGVGSEAFLLDAYPV